MPFETFFNLSLATLAGGVVATGTAALVAALRRRGGRVAFQEPLFSGSLVLLYGPACYFAAAGLAISIDESAGMVLFTVLFIGSVSIHASWAFWHRTLRLRRKAQSETADHEAGLRLLREVGITHVFNGVDDQRLTDTIRDMMSGTRTATLLVPHVGTFLNGRSVLVEALRRACADGATLRVIGAGDRAPDDPVFRAACRISDADGVLPAAWLVLASGRHILFSLNPNRFGSRLYAGDILAPEPDTVPAGLGAFVSDVNAFVESGASVAEVRVATSPAEYKDVILSAEAAAKQIDRIPKRIFVVFKDEATAEAIAAKRYGAGSPSVAHYLEEHRKRRSQFFGGLGRGMICREVYSKADLLRYVTERKHGSVILPEELILKSLHMWRDAIRSQPNYLIGISDDPLPFKYEICDGQTVIMHEAIGVSDRHRLNAVVIHGRGAARRFVEDFELIWERVIPDMRDKRRLVEWIDHELCPLAERGNVDPQETIVTVRRDPGDQS